MRRLISVVAVTVLFSIGVGLVASQANDEGEFGRVSSCALEGEYVVSGVIGVSPDHFYEFKGSMSFHGCPWAPLVNLDFDITDSRIAGISEVNLGWFPYVITPDGEFKISLYGVHIRGNVGLIAPNEGIAHSFTLLSDTPANWFKLVAKATRVHMSPGLRGNKGDKGDRGEPGIGLKGDKGNPGKDGLGKGTAYLCVSSDHDVKWGGLDGSLCDPHDKKIAIVTP